jgi:hypothetical protein
MVVRLLTVLLPHCLDPDTEFLLKQHPAAAAPAAAAAAAAGDVTPAGAAAAAAAVSLPLCCWLCRFVGVDRLPLPTSHLSRALPQHWNPAAAAAAVRGCCCCCRLLARRS